MGRLKCSQRASLEEADRYAHQVDVPHLLCERDCEEGHLQGRASMPSSPSAHFDQTATMRWLSCFLILLHPAGPTDIADAARAIPPSARFELAPRSVDVTELSATYLSGPSNQLANTTSTIGTIRCCKIPSPLAGRDTHEQCIRYVPLCLLATHASGMEQHAKR